MLMPRPSLVKSIAPPRETSLNYIRCACGGMSVPVRDLKPDTPVIVCHCPRCRKHHVSAFASYLQIPSNSVSFEGAPIATFRDRCSEAGDVLRLFCNRCFCKVGTKVVNGADDKDSLLLCMGALDNAAISEECAESWSDEDKHTIWRKDLGASWPDEKPRLTRHNMPPLTQVTGGCSCGASSYRIVFKPPSELQHCYCELCRRLSGSAFMTWVPVPDTDSTWVGNRPPLVRTTSHGQRHICETCGGVLSIVYDAQPGMLWPAAGGFDDDSLPTAEGPACMGSYLHRIVHICCIWKQKWYSLPHDGLPRIDYAS